MVPNPRRGVKWLARVISARIRNRFSIGMSFDMLHLESII